MHSSIYILKILNDKKTEPGDLKIVSMDLDSISIALVTWPGRPELFDEEGKALNDKHTIDIKYNLFHLKANKKVIIF